MSKDARVVELVTELVGAQTVAKMINEAVSNLTDDQKKEIRDAIFAGALAQLARGGYDVTNVVQSTIHAALRDHIATNDELKAQMIDEAKKMLEATWQARVEAIAKMLVETALREVQAKIYTTRF